MYDHDRDRKNLYAIAALGHSSKLFLDSDVGAAVLAKAGNETEDLLIKLRKTSNDDIEGIRKIHLELSIIGKALGWLGEMIEAGNAALDTLERDGEITNGP